MGVTDFRLTFSPGSARTDGWGNVFSGLGQQGYDKAAYTQFGCATDLDVMSLEELYKGDAIAARIVSLPANEMTREWIEFSHGEDPEDAKAIMKAADDLGVREKLREGIQWGRLFGGALVVLAVDDGRKSTEPVSLDTIRSVSIISVLDRWSCFPETYYTDANSPKLGQVQTYRLIPITWNAQVNTIVHESRVLRFEGADLPPRYRLRNWGWGDSVLNRVRDVIRDYQGSIGALPNIVQEFVQTVYKLKGLAQLLTQGGPDADQKIVKRLQALQLGGSLFRAKLLDSEETLERVSLTVTGLGEIIDRIEKRLVASTDMPHNILLNGAPGHAKGALNSGNGDAETRAWYDTVASMQDDQLRKPLAYFLELLMRSKQGPTKGVLPKAWSFTFKPLWQQNAKEESEIKLNQAETDAIYLDRGVLSAGEVAQSRFAGDGYSTDTILDDDARNELGELEQEEPDGDRPPEPPVVSPEGREPDDPPDDEAG